jgi:hypothetical protein
MRTLTPSIPRRVFPALALAGAAALAACDGQVELAESAGTSGSGGGASAATTTATATATTATSTATTTSSSAGAGGSGGSIEPLDCQPEDGAIVVGTSYQGSAIAVLSQGAWSKAAHVVPAAAQIAAYVDVYHQLGVFWIEPGNGVDHAHFTRTKDGSAFEPHEVFGWQPSASAPLFRAGDHALVGADAEGTSVAHYDSDAMDWDVWGSQPVPFTVSSAATLTTSSSTVLLGFDAKHDLCDLTIDAATAAWGAAKCHPELHVATEQEIPSPPPQLVAFPNGDAVAVYFTSYVELTAAVLHAGKWSAPVTTTLPDQSLSFAVTSTPSGDVFAGLVLTSDEVVALRFSPAAGWTAPIAIDTGAHNVQRPAAATGICGDDALFAYSAGGIDGEIRVARVRGASSETTTVAHFVESMPSQISLATRHVPQAF